MRGQRLIVRPAGFPQLSSEKLEQVLVQANLAGNASQRGQSFFTPSTLATFRVKTVEDDNGINP